MKFIKLIVNMTIYFNILLIPTLLVLGMATLTSSIIQYQDWMIWIGVGMFLLVSIIVLSDLALNDPIMK